MKLILVAAAVLLSACSSLPRGAALRSEILAVEGAGGVRDFAVAPVSRAALPVYAAWPDVDAHGLEWIARIDQPNSRIVAPGDTLTVTVWATEENGLLTVTGQRFVSLPQLRVEPGGTVFLPYIGKRRVAGMSVERAREVIEEAYSAVAPSAQVQLDLAAGRMSSASLVGGVAAPGSYPLADRDVTITALIAEAGGVSSRLANPQVRLQRDGRLYGISLGRLLEKPELDTTLRGGDTVFIESDSRYFLSLGAAGTEAQHGFPRDRVSALDALAIIGGVSDTRADVGGILVLRHYPEAAVRAGPSGPDHPRTVFTFDLTSADGLFSAGQFEIASGDLVYVTESPVTAAQTIFGLFGSAFGFARQAGAVAG